MRYTHTACSLEFLITVILDKGLLEIYMTQFMREMTVTSVLLDINLVVFLICLIKNIIETDDVNTRVMGVFVAMLLIITRVFMS